eukprot:g4194.t1
MERATPAPYPDVRSICRHHWKVMNLWWRAVEVEVVTFLLGDHNHQPWFYQGAFHFHRSPGRAEQRSKAATARLARKTVYTATHYLLDKTALLSGLIEHEIQVAGSTRDELIYQSLKQVLKNAIEVGSGVSKLAYADLVEEVERRGGLLQLATDIGSAGGQRIADGVRNCFAGEVSVMGVREDGGSGSSGPSCVTRAGSCAAGGAETSTGAGVDNAGTANLGASGSLGSSFDHEDYCSCYSFETSGAAGGNKFFPSSLQSTRVFLCLKKAITYVYRMLYGLARRGLIPATKFLLFILETAFPEEAKNIAEEQDGLTPPDDHLAERMNRTPPADAEHGDEASQSVFSVSSPSNYYKVDRSWWWKART